MSNNSYFCFHIWLILAWCTRSSQHRGYRQLPGDLIVLGTGEFTCIHLHRIVSRYTKLH